jgi:hypothetical protein
VELVVRLVVRVVFLTGGDACIQVGREQLYIGVLDDLLRV